MRTCPTYNMDNELNIVYRLQNVYNYHCWTQMSLEE